MKGLRRNLFRFFAAAFLSCALAAAMQAQTPAQAGAELARRIVVRVGPGRPVTLKTSNLSTLKPADVSALLAAVQNELLSHGIRLAEQTSAATEVLLTVSENPRGLLAVAQIRQEGSEEIAIVPFARPAETESTRTAETVRLERELLIDLDAPILDAAWMGTTTATRQRLLVLQPDGVAMFEKTDAGWAERSRARTRPPHPWPRDLRGRLLVEGEAFWAYLPGMTCGGAWIESRVPRITLDCAAMDEPWPVHTGGEVRAYANFSPARNFFDGRIQTEQGAAHVWPAFFSAAPIGANDNLRFVLAGLDGRALVFAGGREPEATFSGWGSDIAALETPCGEQVLAAGADESEASDSVRAFEVTEREAVATSASVPFAGPVTALWPASDTSALAVTHNHKTGRYEAYILTAVCSR